MSSKSTTILITGANRGIGKGLLSTFLLRDNHTLIAGLRDPSAQTATALRDLPTGSNSRLLLVKIDSAVEGDAADAMATLKAEHGIMRLDVVVANAGISKYFGTATVTPATEMFDHFTVNTVAPLLLFQATASLLAQSPKPKFIAITSGAGSLAGVEALKVENTAYGASKAALNFVKRRIHAENVGLIAFPINPGWLQTELGNHAATGAGMGQAPTAVQDGVNGIISVIDHATREKTSGKFMSWDGAQIPW